MKLGEQRLRCAYVTSGIGRNTRDTGVAVRQGGFRSSGRASRLGGGSWQQEGGTELVLPLGEAAQPPSAPQTLFLPSQPKCSAKPERLSSHAQAARTTECECTFSCKRTSCAAHGHPTGTTDSKAVAWENADRLAPEARREAPSSIDVQLA